MPTQSRPSPDLVYPRIDQRPQQQSPAKDRKPYKIPTSIIREDLLPKDSNRNDNKEVPVVVPLEDYLNDIKPEAPYFTSGELSIQCLESTPPYLPAPARRSSWLSRIPSFGSSTSISPSASPRVSRSNTNTATETPRVLCLPEVTIKPGEDWTDANFRTSTTKDATLTWTEEMGTDPISRIIELELQIPLESTVAARGGSIAPVYTEIRKISLQRLSLESGRGAIESEVSFEDVWAALKSGERVWALFSAHHTAKDKSGVSE